MVFVFAWCLQVPASTLPDERVIIQVVLDKYIYSHGGRERLESLVTLEIKGTMSLDSQGLDVEVHQRIISPDKMFFVQEFPVLGTTQVTLNGDRGWESHPIAGERPMDKTELKDTLKDTDLHRDLRLIDEYESIRLGLPETIEDIETIHLVMLDADGREEHWYFKEEGDLFQKIHTVISGPESEYESTDRFYDFKTVDGFRFPQTIRFIQPSYVAELTITDCRINQEFDPHIFELPEAAFLMNHDF